MTITTKIKQDMKLSSTMGMGLSASRVTPQHTPDVPHWTATFTKASGRVLVAEGETLQEACEALIGLIVRSKMH